MAKPEKILLIDGMALLFRAFYATAVSGYYMVNSKGIPTNAVYGFVKHMLTAINTIHPSHVICCWDMSGVTFRTELYPDYKGNRSEPPVQLIPQFDIVKEVVKTFDIPNVGLLGYEADDCIGTLANKFCQENEIIILTGDRDILQLLNKNISVYLLQKGFGNYMIYKADTFFAEKGILPGQMVDLKALMGDNSDNYPGVRGIGEKTALKLLHEYQSIEGILENLPSLSKGNRVKIEQDLEMLHLSRKLARIYCNVPVTCELSDAVITINHDKVLSKFKELEFKGIERMIG